MSITDTFENASKSNKKSEWVELKQGINSVRILTEPVVFRQRYFKKLNKTEICYEGCGYAGKGVSTKFLCWAIDNNDATTEDGKPKAKLFKIGWTAMEAFVNKEKINEAMGKPKFTFPMERDVLFMRTGDKLDTSYAVEIADDAKNPMNPEESLDDTKEILESWKKATKERHEKEGAPTLEEESKGSIPDIQLEEEDDLSKDDF